MTDLSYNSRTIARLRTAGISGRTGVGFYQVRFNIAIEVPAWQKDEVSGAPTLYNLKSQVYVSIPNGLPQLLGYAEPESPITIAPSLNPQTSQISFDLNLSAQQMVALEEMRQGNGLQFRLDVFCNADGRFGPQIPRNGLQWPASLSEWSTVLHALNYSDILVIGINVPNTSDNPTIAAAIEMVRRAHTEFLNGSYDAVVSQCRLALESVQMALDVKQATTKAVSKFKAGDARNMDKTERALMIAETARHFANPAHHTDDSGRPFYFSRSDATFLLALVVAVLSNTPAEVIAGNCP